MTQPDWITSWRTGIAPLLDRGQLTALQKALSEDDPRLIQGKTVLPGPISREAPVRGACALAWCAWQADHGERNTVLEIERAFDAFCFLAAELCGGPANLSYFLNWFDESPRHEMRPALLAEVERALAEMAEEVRA